MWKKLELFTKMPLTRQFLILSFVLLLVLLISLNRFIYHSFKDFFVHREEKQFMDMVDNQLRQQLRLYVFRRTWDSTLNFDALVQSLDGLDGVMDVVFFTPDGRFLYSRSGVVFEDEMVDKKNIIRAAKSGEMFNEIHDSSQELPAHLFHNKQFGYVQEFYFPFVVQEETKGVIILFRDFSDELEEINAAQSRATLFSLLLFAGMNIGLYLLMRRIDDYQRKMKEKVSKLEKLSYLGEFSSKMAHEIGNPIHVIAGNIEMLEDVAEDDFTRKRLQIVNHQLSRIQNIIKNYLFVAKEPVPEFRPFNLSEMMDDVQEAMTHTVGGHIRLSCVADDIVVLSDRTFIEQVLYNFIKNASDSIGSQQGSIDVTAHVENGLLTVAVHDTGHGVPKEILAKIFDPFFTTKKTGRGTGLGLSVCHDLVRSLKGSLHCTSEPGNTVFSFTIPVTVEEFSCVF